MALPYELIEPEDEPDYPVAPFLDFARTQPRPEPEEEADGVAP